MGTTKRNRSHTAEKPKGKLRRLRDNASNIARSTREQNRPEIQTGPLYDGPCKPQSCLGEVEEVACVPYNGTTAQHYCLCTSDGRPPTEDFKCPRSTVPVTPMPIHNIIPPTTSNTSTDNRSAGNSDEVSKSFVSPAVFPESSGSDSPILGSKVNGAGVLLAITAIGVIIIIIFFTITIFLLIKKWKKSYNGKSQPRRPGEPLLAERYITNPQYGVYSAAPVQVAVGAGAVIADDTTEQVPLLDRDALTFLEEVGEGCFGKVHKGLLRAAHGEMVVAIKVLKESAGRNAEDDFVREVSIMSAFQHPNILTLVGVVYRDDIGASPWMVFEYMEWGDLAGVLRGSRGGGRPGPYLDDPDLLHVALQVARGMQYLASRRFVHRDLAARNCLVGANLAVKIADFGMSRDVYTSDYYKMGGERPMPVRWMSPESIVYARFTHESDVWSYGVVLWEIYSRGKQPFYGHNNDGATKLILQGIVLVPPEDCPRFACELMRACWKTDPRDRIEFDEICRKLEVAAAAGVPPTQLRLPCPPPPSQDSAGYLIPAQGPAVDYLAPLPDPEHEMDSETSEEEEDEYT